MEGIWDIRADSIQEGDWLREISPIARKTRVDNNGYTNYLFSKQTFNNPNRSIPDEEFELFKDFLDGGTQNYPSDGIIPCDIAAAEARKVLDHIVACSKDLSSPYYEKAKTALKNGKKALVRGAIKLYLGKYTTRDWRRKRFTDEINFWTFQVGLLNYVLRQIGWVKNNETGEWEKNLEWTNPETGVVKHDAVCIANNLNKLLDFGAGSYLEGTELKDIFNKKLKRGHDVDLSDIMNVALYKDNLERRDKNEWNEAWEAFEAATNTRSSRITSNLISLCRYSLGTADYLERVSKTINKYHEKILDSNEYPDEKLEKICRMSLHWINFLKENGPNDTRNMILEFLLEQKDEKKNQAKNLREFVAKLLKLLNTKYEYQKIIFEIEN